MVKNDLVQLKKDDKAISDMITQLEECSNIHIITMPKKGEFNATIVDKQIANKRIPQGTIVYYNPHNKKTINGNARTPRVGLVHELQHSSDADKGTFYEKGGTAALVDCFFDNKCFVDTTLTEVEKRYLFDVMQRDSCKFAFDDESGYP